MNSKVNAIVISEADNVAVAIEPINKDDVVYYLDKKGNPIEITALDDIKIYHKIAIVDIKKNKPVVKYGEHIGFAIRDIKIGEHIHDHNIEGRREDLESIE